MPNFYFLFTKFHINLIVFDLFKQMIKAINLSFEVVRKAKNNNLNDLQKLSVIEKYVLNHGYFHQ